MERKGTWRIYDAANLYDFVKCLSLLFPEDAVLYLEGAPIAQDIQEYMEAHRPAQVTRVAMGSIGPAIVFNPLNLLSIKRVENIGLHMQLTTPNLHGLVELMRVHGLTPEVGDHLHAYSGDVMLMEGHDWNVSDQQGFHVNGDVSEERVSRFCERVGCRYEWSQDYGPAENREQR